MYKANYVAILPKTHRTSYKKNVIPDSNSLPIKYPEHLFFRKLSSFLKSFEICPTFFIFTFLYLSYGLNVKSGSVQLVLLQRVYDTIIVAHFLCKKFKNKYRIKQLKNGADFRNFLDTPQFCQKIHTLGI